jgi:hypothetical protein
VKARFFASVGSTCLSDVQILRLTATPGLCENL